MPLLLPLLLLAGVLVVATVLGLAGMVRRPFRPPAWRPVLPALLAFRAGLLIIVLAATALVSAWRHPAALGALALGVCGGLVLGAASALSARVERTPRGLRQQPRRAFAATLALVVLIRAVAVLAGGAGGETLLASLLGLLLGYPLAHALALRVRARRRLRRGP